MNAVLVISARDNVATALEPLEAGRSVTVRNTTVVAAEAIPRGHKIALRAIPAGDAVIKYGSPIGTASCDIAPGAHVHTHNVASARGRGDLGAAGRSDEVAEAPKQRIAEPVE
ncbi:MAG TPA: UxaA family hydrolase [Vicinamibacterales bacterium]|nr:UxaA family hydrolase [Vicinamibacterales bacterium]